MPEPTKPTAQEGSGPAADQVKAVIVMLGMHTLDNHARESAIALLRSLAAERDSLKGQLRNHINLAARLNIERDELQAENSRLETQIDGFQEECNTLRAHAHDAERALAESGELRAQVESRRNKAKRWRKALRELNRAHAMQLRINERRMTEVENLKARLGDA